MALVYDCHRPFSFFLPFGFALRAEKQQERGRGALIVARALTSTYERHFAQWELFSRFSLPNTASSDFHWWLCASYTYIFQIAVWLFALSSGVQWCAVFVCSALFTWKVCVRATAVQSSFLFVSPDSSYGTASFSFNNRPLIPIIKRLQNVGQSGDGTAHPAGQQTPRCIHIFGSPDVPGPPSNCCSWRSKCRKKFCTGKLCGQVRILNHVHATTFIIRCNFQGLPSSRLWHCYSPSLNPAAFQLP